MTKPSLVPPEPNQPPFDWRLTDDAASVSPAAVSLYCSETSNVSVFVCLFLSADLVLDFRKLSYRTVAGVIQWLEIRDTDESSRWLPQDLWLTASYSQTGSDPYLTYESLFVGCKTTPCHTAVSRSQSENTIVLKWTQRYFIGILKTYFFYISTSKKPLITLH